MRSLLSVMASTKTTPRDALVMASILKDMGIIEYEPRVINQMLEFTYRYITNILDDARVFSSHAKKKSVDVEDVKLAIQMQMDKSFTTPPPRDILIDIARQRNNMPLPLIKPHCGPRLPPDRYCLSACNYHMKAAKKSRQHGAFTSISAPKINLSSVAPKLNPAINLASKSGSTLSLVGKGLAPPTVTVVTRPATAVTTATSSSSSFSGYIPTPIIKPSNSSLSSLTTPTSISSSSSSSSVTPTITATVTVSSSVVPKIQTKIQTKVVAGCSVSAGASTATTETPIVKIEPSNKRKREDDDYDAE